MPLVAANTIAADRAVNHANAVRLIRRNHGARGAVGVLSFIAQK